MASILKNVASQNVTFGMVNATTGAADASATVTVYVTKDNGSQATGTGTVTNSGHGQYNYAPVQAETNAVDVGFVFTATGDVPVFYDFHTDISTVAGAIGVDWASVQNPTSTVGLTGTTISSSQTVASVSGSVGSVTGNVGGSVASVTGAVGSVTGNVGGNVVGSVGSVIGTVTANTTQLAGQIVTAAAGVTFPASVASPTNITAGTITTVTNLTNAPTSGDFTATMKTSLNNSTPTSVTTVTGNVNGSVGSVTGGVTVTTNNDKTGYSLTQAFPSNFSSLSITAGGAAKIDGTTALTESYASQGASLTLAQALYGITQFLGQHSTSGMVWSIQKRDGVTTAKTYTLDSATTPTLISETT